MEVVSVCVKCQTQNQTEVDDNGRGSVTCTNCSTVYGVQTYEVRAKGGRRDRSTGIKNYNIRVKEPDRDETMLQFSSKQDIEMRSGDWITASVINGKIKYLLNHKIHTYWDVQQGMGGCLGILIIGVICVYVMSSIFI